MHPFLPTDQSNASGTMNHHTTKSHMALALPLLAASLACADGTPMGSEATARDSAGVVIVQNTGSIPPEGGTWSVASEPDLTVGKIEGDSNYQLFGVAGAHRLADGRIAVVNAGSWQVRVYDSQGTFLHSYGRRGAGPEEFGMPVLGGVIGDTLVIVDRGQHRLAMVHPDRGFVRLATVDDAVGGYLNPSGIFSNGQIVFGGAFDMRRIGDLQEGMNRAPTFYRSCNPDGSLATDFGDRVGAEFFIRDLDGDGAESRPALIPFGKRPMATVSLSHFYYAAGDEFEIEAYDPTGRLTRLIRLDRDPIPVTAEDGNRYVEEMAAQATTDNRARMIRQQLSQLPLPETFPAFATMMADELGYLWVQQQTRPGQDDSGWEIFDPEGVLTARVSLPSRVSPLEIGADYLLGLHWDQLEVEYLHLYRVERPSE